MATLYLEDEDVFNFSGAGVSQPALTAAHIEEAAGEEGIIAQLMDIRQLFFTMCFAYLKTVLRVRSTFSFFFFFFKRSSFAFEE